MKAVWYERGGPAAEVLQCGEMDAPEPGEGEVRVKIVFSAANPHDTKRRAAGNEVPEQGRIIPHSDGSGEIDRVGVGVPEDRIGEQVWLFGAQVGQTGGSCAQYCVVPDWKAVPLIKGASLRDGACLGIPAVTAVTALYAGGSVTGKNVLVAGGAGRVGAYAVQFAKLAGARVTATASAKDCTAVVALGAVRCLDYSDPELLAHLREDTGKKGYDLIIEPRFASNIDLNARALSRNGIIAAYGFDDNPTPNIPARQLLMRNATCRFVGIFGLGRREQEAAIRQVNELLQQGSVQHRIGMETGLAEAARSHEAIEGGHLKGAALVAV